MNNLAKVISSKVQDGLRLIKAVIQGKDDTRDAYLAQGFGEDAAPDEDNGLIGVYAYTGHNGEPVLIGYINSNSKVKPGEKRLFSTDGSGSEQTFLYLLQNGEQHLGGNGDFVTRFLEMEKAFNEFKNDFNNFVSTYNTHKHPFTGAPPGSEAETKVTPTTGTPTQANMADAKVEKVKTIGK